MQVTVVQLIALVAAVFVAGFLIHKYLPGSVAAKAEDAVIAEARKVEPTIEAAGLQALAAAEAWLTDTTAQKAAIAKAQSEIATKEAALRTHIATLAAKLPPASTAASPGA